MAPNQCVIISMAPINASQLFSMYYLEWLRRLSKSFTLHYALFCFARPCILPQLLLTHISSIIFSSNWWPVCVILNGLGGCSKSFTLHYALFCFAHPCILQQLLLTHISSIIFSSNWWPVCVILNGLGGCRKSFTLHYALFCFACPCILQ